jgi:hypothetical protein
MVKFELHFTQSSTLMIGYIKEVYHHELEPFYPYDKELNKTGYRADFLVGKTFIEYFGLMHKNSYKEKSNLKRQLAQKYQINLIELYSEDLTGEGLQLKLKGLVEAR